MADEGVHMVVAVSNDFKPDKLNKMEPTIFESFTKLKNEAEASRLEGGISLLRRLLQQNADQVESKEFTFAMIRLIRGLGSSKPYSRKGFYTTLTVFLTMHPGMFTEKILSIVDTELHPVGSNNKGENADIYMGRILAYGALIRSKLLSANSNETKLKVIQDLIHSGKKRSYLSFVSVLFLIEFINQIDTETFKESVWPVVEKEFGKPWSEQTLDTFYILLVVEEKFPMLINKKFLKEHLNTDKLVSIESMENIVKVLTDLPRIISYQHPIFKIFCEKLSTAGLIADFWSHMDQRFLKPSKSDEYVATEIFKLILSYTSDKSVLPTLLSPNFVQHVLKRFSNCKRHENDELIVGFKEILNKLISVTNGKDVKVKTQISVLKKLILCPGDLMIEKKTGTRVIQMITANLNFDGVKKLSKIYRDIMENTISKEKQNIKAESFWTNAERTYAAHLLTRLMGLSITLTDQEWRLDQLKFLFNHGLCEMPNVGIELAPQFRETFYRALDHKLPKLNDLRNVLSALVHDINSRIKSKSLNLRNPLTDEAKEAWEKLIHLIKELESNSKKAEALPVFHTMNLHMGLQLFSDPNLAITSINELHSCYERSLKKSKKSKPRSAKNEEDEPEWVEVVVDLLLSLYSKNSHLLRSLVGCVFPHICPYVTPAAIHQILAVLDVRNEKGPLVDKSHLDDDESSEEDSNSDTDNEDTEESEQTDSDSNSNEESVEEDEDEDETATDRLRMAVRQALGDASMQTDDEDINVDEIDEEEGKRLDESLAAAFRIIRDNRQPRSKKQEKSAQALTHFRVRVIDLLEAYLESGPSMAIVFDMLIPLFSLLEYCIKDPHQKPLQDRVRSCLKKLSLVKKFKDTEGVNDELLSVVLKALIEKGERTASVCHEMSDKLAECCTFLVRSAHQAELSTDVVVGIYGENLTSFFKKRDCVLPPMLFKSILQLHWEGNWQLAPLLVDFAFDSSVRPFRRGQALEFLTVFYKNGRLVHSDTKHVGIRMKMEKKLCENTINMFNELSNVHKDESEKSTRKNSNEIGKEIRQKHICILLGLLRIVYSQHLPEAWNWKAIGKALATYRIQVTLAKDTKRAYNKLAVQIGISVNISTKKKKTEEPSKINGKSTESSIEESDVVKENGKIDSESEVSAVTKSELKKRKKSKGKQRDKQLLKKEARTLREKAMSEGFETFTFSSFALSNESDETEMLQNGDSTNQEARSNFPQKRTLAFTTDSIKPKRKKSMQTA